MKNFFLDFARARYWTKNLRVIINYLKLTLLLSHSSTMKNFNSTFLDLVSFAQQVLKEHDKNEWQVFKFQKINLPTNIVI
jgi:hypothetical protein